MYFERHKKSVLPNTPIKDETDTSKKARCLHITAGRENSQNSISIQNLIGFPRISTRESNIDITVKILQFKKQSYKIYKLSQDLSISKLQPSVLVLFHLFSGKQNYSMGEPSN